MKQLINHHPSSKSLIVFNLYLLLTRPRRKSVKMCSYPGIFPYPASGTQPILVAHYLRGTNLLQKDKSSIVLHNEVIYSFASEFVLFLTREVVDVYDIVIVFCSMLSDYIQVEEAKALNRKVQHK